MEDVVYYSNLYDYYASLLTDTQKEYFIAYYFNNLSLTEIAEEYNVSKNAISKTLLEVKNKLDDYEQKLQLFHNKEKITKIVSDDVLKQIEDYI